MGKKKGKRAAKVKTIHDQPGVSCCCPTMLKRAHFLPQTIHLFTQQDYTGEMELLLFCDEFADGGAAERHFLKTVEEGKAGLKKNQSIRVLTKPEKLVLGHKRQLMATEENLKEIICWWDDDDYFYPCRVSYSVKRLTSNRALRAVGCSAQEIFFATLCCLYRVEAMPNPNHATCGTMCMYSKLFKKNNGLEEPPLTFEHQEGFAEERQMLRNYSVRLGQLDPSKIIMIISHGSTNTVAKEQLTNRSNLNLVTTSSKSLEKIIQSFTKKDHRSTQFYLKLIQLKEDQGESSQWKQYRDGGRQDIFYIDGKHLDRDSETFKRLNGLS